MAGPGRASPDGASDPPATGPRPNTGFSANADAPTRDRSHGEHLAAVQSHYDDLALSLAATLHCTPAFLRQVITTHSESADTRARQIEDGHLIRALESAPAEVGLVELSDQPVPPLTLPIETALCLAPAGVGRNRDHWATRQAAGTASVVTIHWEDVAFWGIYGMSSDDRIEFTMRNKTWLADRIALNIDSSDGLTFKRDVLHHYPSQSTDVWRPLRYGLLTAIECGMPGRHVERVFVRSVDLEHVCRILNLETSPLPALHYGTRTLPSLRADFRRTERP